MSSAGCASIGSTGCMSCTENCASAVAPPESAAAATRRDGAGEGDRAAHVGRRQVGRRGDRLDHDPSRAPWPQLADLPPADVRRAVAFAGASRRSPAAALSGGATALAQFSVQTHAAGAADARAAGRGHGRGARRSRTAAWSSEARRRPRAGAQERRRRAASTRGNLNDVTAPRAGDRGRGARRARSVADPRRRGDRAARERPAASLPVTMSRFGSQQDSAARRSELPLSVFFFDCLYRDGAILFDHPTRERRAALTASAAARAGHSAVVTADRRRRPSGSIRKRSAAGHEGVMAKALDAPYEAGRRGAGWLKVEARPHARPRGAGGGVGARPPARLAVEPAPRRPRSGDRRLRHARQNVQGPDRRDARVADRGVPQARDPARRMDGARRPELVVEIAFNDLQESSQYPAGSRCASRASRATAPTSAPRRPIPSTPLRRIYAESVA